MSAKTFLYVGNWHEKPTNWTTGAPSGCGIATFDFSPDSGQLEFVKSDFDRISIGATHLDEQRSVLYCVNEVMTLPGRHMGGGGEVYAFAIDKTTGDLKELNHQPSFGSLPSFVTTDGDGSHLLVTNHVGFTPITKIERNASGKYEIQVEYDDATTVLYLLEPDGAIGDPVDVFKHHGKGPLPAQASSHIHSVVMSPSKDLFAACDKGGDEIIFFKIDKTNQKLTVCPGSPYRSVPGSSPRYSAFHPRLPYFFVNHETKPIISAFRYDRDGRLELVETVDALSDTIVVDSNMKPSDLRMHPSGEYLYTIVRGINVVNAFSVNEETGGLKLIQCAPLDGKGPRGCAISPDGKYMAIAALESKEVLMWSIADDGTLKSTGHKVSQPCPGTVTFYAPS